MYNTAITPYGYVPNQTGITPVSIPQQQRTDIKPPTQNTENNQNFENDYWQFQTSCAVNNQISINKNNNYNIGRNIMKEFYKKYPKMDSFTMSETLAKRYERKSNLYLAQKWKAKADEDFKTMMEFLDKRPDNKDVTFDEYINIIEKEFQEYNFANCGERAYYLHNEMNKKGIDNTIIEIGGNSAENSHVFNVIGLDKNADINNPDTWGENAVVIDVWANKLYSPKEAVAYYKDFLNYGENNPMEFKKLDINKIFKKA